MNKTKFTKGPWVIDGKYSTFLAVSANDVVVCDVSCCHDGYHIKPSGEELANAHLISCSPDMYEMLERVISNYQVLASIAAQNGIVFDEYAEDSKDTESLLKRARGG